jgi:tetrapyrrole methylase family protein / MazG family protein
MVELVRSVLAEEQAAALILPGRPWPGDGLKGLLQRLEPGEVLVQQLPGEDIVLSLLEAIDASLDGEGDGAVSASSKRGVTLIDASCGDALKDPPQGGLLINQVYSQALLAKLARQLCQIYPPDHAAALWQFDQAGKAALSGVWALQELTTSPPVSLHAWSFLYLEPAPRCSLGEMTAIMAELRSPKGCPWDRQQDHHTLKPYLLEEAYEVLEAIDSGDRPHLCEELGDLLLQVIFHSELAREQGHFSLWDVVDGITRKIYRRHPHVFQEEKLADAGAVVRRWQEIKLEEKGGKETDRFALPPGLPALMKAQKVQKRAAAVGFDWPHVDGALEKVAEELKELEEARVGEGKERVAEEYGDLLFAIVNVARFLGVDAEQALSAAVRKFIHRFAFIEGKVKATGEHFETFSLEELDIFWDEAKKKNK